MGAGTDRITMKQIQVDAGEMQKGDRRGSFSADLLDEFDARNAQCYLREDQERLLAMVEAGFGDLDSFNEHVRDILKKADTRRGFVTTLRGTE